MALNTESAPPRCIRVNNKEGTTAATHNLYFDLNRFSRYPLNTTSSTTPAANDMPSALRIWLKITDWFNWAL